MKSPDAGIDEFYAKPKPTARGTHVLRIAASALAGVPLEMLQKALDLDMAKRGMSRADQERRIGMRPELGMPFRLHRDDPEKVSAAEAKRARKNAKRLAEAYAATLR